MNRLILIAMMFFPPLAFAQSAPLDLYKFGGAFGRDKSWQIGLDKSPTAGACMVYDVADKAYLAGPCRDFIILSRRGEAAAHLGYAMLFDLGDMAQAHPAHNLRAGLNVGPAAKAALARVAEKIPALEDLAGYRAPGWAAYLGRITTLDAALGYRPDPAAGQARWPWGFGLKADIPLSDLVTLLGGR